MEVCQREICGKAEGSKRYEQKITLGKTRIFGRGRLTDLILDDSIVFLQTRVERIKSG